MIEQIDIRTTTRHAAGRQHIPQDGYSMLAVAILEQAQNDIVWAKARREKTARGNSHKTTNRDTELRKTYNPIKYLQSENSAELYLDAVGIESHCVTNWINRFVDDNPNFIW